MSICLRCLSRQAFEVSRGRSSSSSLIAKLSTSATRHAQSARPGSEARGKKTLKLSKRKIESKGKLPEPGERKAIRKRIVLSNTNAFDVEDLKELNGSNFSDASVRGSVMALPGLVVDSLRALESFKPSQAWSFFRRPAALVRQETLDLATHINRLNQHPGNDTLRKLVVGDRGSGKSVLLLQAQAMAIQAGWVVFHIPDTQELTNATTEYQPLQGTRPTKYVQRTYMANLLGRIARANQAVLSRMQISQQHNLPVPVQSNMSLDRFAQLGSEDAGLAWPIFEALWQELNASGRPPILYTLDNIAHVGRLSSYLTPNMYNIHACDLAILDHFVSHFSGLRTMANGGMVLAADSASNRPVSPALDLAIRQHEAGDDSTTQALTSNYAHTDCDPRVLDIFQRAGIMQLQGLTQEECKTLLEYYAKSGMLRHSVSDGAVTERLMLSGGGIIGELERYSLRAHA